MPNPKKLRAFIPYDSKEWVIDARIENVDSGYPHMHLVHKRLFDGGIIQENDRVCGIEIRESVADHPFRVYAYIYEGSSSKDYIEAIDGHSSIPLKKVDITEIYQPNDLLHDFHRFSILFIDPIIYDKQVDIPEAV
ncbi:MAG: hypothetical protein F4100_05485 [Rhodothermaceae bacterium]|nr:hypothetical protein [Rhodothermaceae bacterium]MYE63437.1 hypothetical protein [Rhodothermaceae bacterium]MYJ20183.1 hypothetical protein [Rhodothermaceae bacterium]